MSQSQDLVQVMTDEQRAQSHREAQQRYYYRKKAACEFYEDELQRLRNQVSYLNGQLAEKETSKNQLQTQLNEKNTTISQLQQQVADRNTTITQLQGLLSRCSDREEVNRIQELVQALTNEIQRGQTCLQTINQLNSENTLLKIFRDLVIEINEKYPKFLPSFVYSIQQPGVQVSSPEISNWAREQLSKINPMQLLPLQHFK